ncbi:hypothetical protein CYMTET_13979 [Cymbomonas tetramitiformis]|uniref:Uncharacterized protein n=1 Tax=Cymbomonas tetramitiformis TaxID=36881 RepID=A0AAE0GHC5_9CHLO|nr:hypothetical protein CYMTET_13979 [Cymbomonas tetramitiformis]
MSSAVWIEYSTVSPSPLLCNFRGYERRVGGLRPLPSVKEYRDICPWRVFRFTLMSQILLSASIDEADGNCSDATQVVVENDGVEPARTSKLQDGVEVSQGLETKSANTTSNLHTGTKAQENSAKRRRVEDVLVNVVPSEAAMAARTTAAHRREEQDETSIAEAWRASKGAEVGTSQDLRNEDEQAGQILRATIAVLGLLHESGWRLPDETPDGGELRACERQVEGCSSRDKTATGATVPVLLGGVVGVQTGGQNCSDAATTSHAVEQCGRSRVGQGVAQVEATSQRIASFIELSAEDVENGLVDVKAHPGIAYYR